MEYFYHLVMIGDGDGVCDEDDKRYGIDGERDDEIGKPCGVGVVPRMAPSPSLGGST